MVEFMTTKHRHKLCVYFLFVSDYDATYVIFVSVCYGANYGTTSKNFVFLFQVGLTTIQLQKLCVSVGMNTFQRSKLCVSFFVWDNCNKISENLRFKNSKNLRFYFSIWR